MRTRTPIGRAFVAVATLVVAGAALVVGGVRAEPATAAASCVAVVVDSHLLGGGVQTGCAQGDPKTGLQALAKAGFSYTPRPKDGLICQIDAQPACSDTTTTKYWSYWYRAAGSSSWVYATEGAGAHNPKPGSTEGWVWQSGGKIPPPAIRADVICPQLDASPTPTPTHSKTSKPTPEPTPKPTAKPHSTATGSTPGAPTTAASTSAGRTPGATASAAAPSPTTSPDTAGSASPLAVSAGGSGGGSTPADHGGGGSLGGPAGIALGGAVVVAIGAAAGFRARRGRAQ